MFGTFLTLNFDLWDPGINVRGNSYQKGQGSGSRCKKCAHQTMLSVAVHFLYIYTQLKLFSFVFQDSNVKACLPLNYSDNDYKSKDTE